MTAGTGLPIKDRAPTLLEPPPRAQISTAGNEMLGRALQGFGETVAKIGEDRQKLEDARALADIRRGAIETGQNIATQFPTDHEAFDAAMKAYADKQMSSVDQRYVNAVRDEAETVRLGMRDNIMRAAFSQDKRLATDSLNATLESTASRAGQSAYRGDLTQTGVNLELYEKTVRDGVASGLFSQERAKLLLEEARGQVESERLMGSLYGTYQTRGKAGVMEEIDKFKADPTVSWDMAKRERFEGRAVSDLNRWEAARHGDAAVLDEQAKSAKEALALGVARPTDIEALAAGYERVGQPGKAYALRRDMQTQGALQAMYLQPVTKARELERTLTAKAAGVLPAQAQQVADAATAAGVDPVMAMTIARIESGFRPDAITGRYRGIYQLDPEAASRFKAGVDAASQINAGLASLTERSADLTKRLGRQPEPWEIYVAHQQGAAGYEALSSSPNARAVDVLSRFKDGDPLTKVRGNLPDGLKASAETMTAGEFIGVWRDKYNAVAREFTGGVDPHVLKMVRENITQREELLKSDPFTYAMRAPGAPTTPAVPWGDEAAAITELQRRTQWASGVARSVEIGAMPPLTKSEVDGLKGRYEDADALGKVSILNAITKGVNLPDARRELLQRLSADKPTLAVAGMLADVAPSVAAGIVSGDEVRKSDRSGGYAPKQNAVLETTLASALGGAFRGADYGAISEAVVSHYAHTQSQAGKINPAGLVDPKQLEASINAVTGGILEHNNLKIPAHKYGATQEQFDAALAAVPPAQLTGAYLARADGGRTPFGPELLSSSNIILNPLNNGRYGVMWGNPSAPLPVRRADGSALVINLNGG